MTDRIDRISALPDTEPNRGWLNAVERFGTDAEQRAARQRIGELNQEARETA